MNKHKIEHPFLVPDDFFESFKDETVSKLTKLQEDRTVKMKKIIMQSAKYAAIVAFSFFMGRESLLFVNQDKESKQEELYSIDVVYSQVSDDDITDYIIENASSEMLEQKNL